MKKSILYLLLSVITLNAAKAQKKIITIKANSKIVVDSGF